MNLPTAILSQHIAVVGKTGSGKTSTAKLIVERVAADARVCILDPIKSDWWGLISSADGKSPGLPFHVLGGPRGHVPLHDGAGKAIGELVATGALPLSIVDMADFKPGGTQRFFIDFAEALFKRMRGVVYLVIEEAHEFAPKERAGIGEENIAIHWAKKLASAGRSKGIRLVVVTQRTQSLHNALLGACDTLIAHRLTLPADQKPIIDWLKANLDKPTMERVATSLSSLKTGTGWICSGEAQLTEMKHFPRIATYDNSATPTGDMAELVLRTAAVDEDKLRAIIGAAVQEAEANDPKVLKARIRELERRLAKADQVPDPAALATARRAGHDEAYATCQRIAGEALERVSIDVTSAREAIEAQLETVSRRVGELFRLTDFAPRPVELARVQPAPTRPVAVGHAPDASPTPIRQPGSGAKLTKAERAILAALAQHGTCSKAKVAILTGYAGSGGGFNNALSSLKTAGFIDRRGDDLQISGLGIGTLGSFERLPTGAALLDHWMRQLNKAEAAALSAIADAYPKEISKQDVARVAGYEASGGGFNNALSRLRTLGLVTGSAALLASEDLF